MIFWLSDTHIIFRKGGTGIYWISITVAFENTLQVYWDNLFFILLNVQHKTNRLFYEFFVISRLSQQLRSPSFERKDEYYIHNESEKKLAVVAHLEITFYAGGFPWGTSSHKVTSEQTAFGRYLNGRSHECFSLFSVEAATTFNS